MQEPLIASSPQLPALTRENDVINYVKKAQRPSMKCHEFCILYQTKGLDGNLLPDAEYAEQLKQTLLQEQLTSGKQVDVISINETDDNVEQVFHQMSTSVVILVVFSEAALQTFANDAHDFKQNNYLLYLQFALCLHDARGVRMLGLNLVDQQVEEARHYVKFQGWCVRFNDVPHYSEWIQDSISKSMRRIFAIQGINIDTEDWEFKIPVLFSTLYEMQDELNATRWTSILKIIPWRSVWGLLAVFTFSFFLPFFAFISCFFYNKFSSKSNRHKEGYFNVSLFGCGLSLIIMSTIALSIAVYYLTEGALCRTEVRCEILISAGDRWTLWWRYADTCECYDDTTNPFHYWTNDFSNECAQCVCRALRDQSAWEDDDQILCDSSKARVFIAITCLLAALGITALAISLKRLRKQSLVAKREIKIAKKKTGISREKALLHFEMNSSV